MENKYVCNELYKHLIPEDLRSQILFLADEQFQKGEADFSETEVMIGQPFLMQKTLLDRMPKLKWLQDTGAGYDAADCAEIKRRNIILTNSRGVMSNSIAEDALFKMLFFARKARQVEQDKKEHKWDMFGQDQWMCQCYGDLYGKTLGVLGFGSIGQEIAKRAKAFHMRIVAYDISNLSPDAMALLDHYYKGGNGIYSVLEESDFVSINLPLLPATRHVINDEAFSHMKPTAMLMNLARGPIVDEDALYRALKAHKIAWAACDVFEKEPLPASSPLWELDNMFITSHKAGMGDSWTTFIGKLIARNLRHYMAKEPLENVIRL
jgi:phosphoglycerate dehydrogenase-like enzyme